MPHGQDATINSDGTQLTSEAELDRLDRKVRGIAFWRTLLFVLGIVLVGQWVERSRSYSLADVSEIKHGGYGLSLAKIPERQEGTFRVLMLGNSVYQGSHVGRNFRKFAEQEGRAIEFLNLAQTGANISDYPLALGWALSQDSKPDAVIVSLGSFTFSDLGFLFNTDAHQLAYEPGVRAVVPGSFYERHFDRTDAANGLINVASPLRRLDTPLQYEADKAALKGLKDAGYDASWLASELPLPKLNLVLNEFADDRKRGLQPEGAAWLNRPFKDDARETFEELLAMIERSGAAIFVIRQECREYPISGEALDLVTGAMDREWGVPVTFVDYESRWDDELFMDQIHPVRDYLEGYARGHYDEFIGFLDRVGLGDRIPMTAGEQFGGD